MFTSKTASLPNGDNVFYTDSGLVSEKPDYATLVIIHGAAFAARSLEHVNEYARKYSMRLIVMQRKHYPGSTPYTISELDDLKQGKRMALDRLGVLVAQFLKHIIDVGGVPKFCVDADGHKRGGISILSLSIGAVTAATLFSDCGDIPRELLGLYINNLIICDPPFGACGFSPPNADFSPYKPWNEHGIDGAKFLPFVSSYFNPPPKDWSGDITKLDTRERAERTSFDDWPREKVHAITHHEALESEAPMLFGPMEGTVKEMVQHALFDEACLMRNFPQVGVIWIFAAHSSWMCRWAQHMAQKTYNDHVKRGEKIRLGKFFELPYANHFAQLDFPDEFISYISGIIC